MLWLIYVPDTIRNTFHEVAFNLWWLPFNITQKIIIMKISFYITQKMLRLMKVKFLRTYEVIRLWE